MKKVITPLVCFLLFASASVYTKEAVHNTCTCDPKETSKAFTAVAKKAMPAVIFLKVEGTSPQQNPFGMQGESPFDYFGDDFLQRFFGVQPRGSSPRQGVPQITQGSGFFVSSDGYIITNAHNVKGADKITAILDDDRELEAKLIGADPTTDIAVLKVEGKDLPFVSLGDSDDMEVGEWAIAIGSPFQLKASLTVGVISAKGRQNLKISALEDFIQTDAAINPGNSGGPLLNLDAEVIGINTAIISKSGGYMGIGFAIPSNIAKHVMNQLIENGSVVRGFLGVSLQPIDQEMAETLGLDKAEGALVAEVIKGSPAEKGDLKQGDIILEYDDTPIKTPAALHKAISFMKPDSIVKLKVNRNGKILTLHITIGKSSDSILASGGVVQQLGLEVENLTPEVAKQLGYPQETEGVVITRIKPSSTAAQAGLRPGFLILAINHKKVKDLNEFHDAINQEPNQKRILILARQGNVTRFYSIRLD